MNIKKASFLQSTVFTRLNISKEIHNPVVFDEAYANGKSYGGSEPKIGVTYKNNNWILKYRKNRHGNLINNHISEYVGSKLFSTLGLETQIAELGVYKGNEIVGVRDFTNVNEVLVPHRGIGEGSTYSEERLAIYEYAEIEQDIINNKKLKDKDFVLRQFWRMFVVDAILGNFDRHGFNWGYLKDTRYNIYRIAPIFDCGSCLFPALLDEDIEKHLMDYDETRDRVYKFPTSQIKLNKRKSSYYDVINSQNFKGCIESVKWLKSVYDEKYLEQIINHDMISEKRQEFIKHIVSLRYHCIIEGGNFDDRYKSI